MAEYSREKWNAIISNDKAYDGKFFYAVRSTKIFCRPSCPSKPPLRENVVYFSTAEEALASGYRPCKRCRPDLLEFSPTSEIACQAKALIDCFFADKSTLVAEMEKLDASKRYINEAFSKQYGQTVNEYVNFCRFESAKTQLENGTQSVLEISLSLGFESLSSFYAFFKKRAGISPGDYRKQLQEKNLLPGDECYYVYDLAFGKMAVACAGGALTAVRFSDYLEGHGKKKSNHITDLAAVQLEEYFAGTRKEFTLSCDPRGTAFQKKVWAYLMRIPYGSTKSYKQVAAAIESPNASRAVGMANNKNSLIIIIPCHRVIGSDGSLVGYAASLQMKKRLLDLEQLHKND